MNKYISKLLKPIFLIIIALIVTSFSDGAKHNTMLLEPSYAPLQEGETSFMATIYDESTVTEIQDISFFGHASIGGIRQENDDSMNKLELNKIKELIIVKSSYESKRFRDREFTLVKIITANDVLVENLLVPKHIVICGIESKTQMERAWFLNKIDKMVIEKSIKKESPEVVIEKIFNKEQAGTTREEIKTEPEEQIVYNTKEKKHNVKNAATRFWDASIDLITELTTTVKSWF